MALRLCCQHFTEKCLSISSFCCFFHWFNMCWLEWNYCWIWWKSFMPPRPRYRGWGKTKGRKCVSSRKMDWRYELGVFFKTVCALFIDKILPYHVYLLVSLLCSDEVDDVSWFSLLSCFHGLLDKSTKEEAEVKTELWRWINSEAPGRRQKSGTFVLVCVIHLSRIRLRAWKKRK